MAEFETLKMTDTTIAVRHVGTDSTFTFATIATSSGGRVLAATVESRGKQSITPRIDGILYLAKTFAESEMIRAGKLKAA